MWLVAELFESLPEAGDLPKPKLVVFLDEAHLLFADATPAFLASIERTVRLIRSKGVGVFFVTQTPKDVPGDVLAQLGSRVQHALRAFTPDDAKALRATVSTFPKSNFYDLEALLPALGIGEAAVTILSDAASRRRSCTRAWRRRGAHGPGRRRRAVAKASPLWAEYGTRVDPQRRARSSRGGWRRRKPTPRPRWSTSRSRSRRGSAAGRPRRAGRRRRLPELARGQGDPARGHPRRLRDAAQAAVRPLPPFTPEPEALRAELRAFVEASCARTRRSGRPRAGSPTRCSAGSPSAAGSA